MKSYLARLHPYWLWLLFAGPAISLSLQVLTSSDPETLKSNLHPPGEISAIFMVVAMSATPLGLLFKGARVPRWLIRNRRYLGVSAFGYGLLHTVFYLIDKAALDPVISDLPNLYIWTGWLAFIIFVPLAATSNTWFVKRLGRWWKRLQRWTYAAAVLVLLHWASLYDWGGSQSALIIFTPLALLEAYRIWHRHLRPRAQSSAQT